MEATWHDWRHFQHTHAICGQFQRCFQQWQKHWNVCVYEENTLKQIMSKQVFDHSPNLPIKPCVCPKLEIVNSITTAVPHLQWLCKLQLSSIHGLPYYPIQFCVSTVFNLWTHKKCWRFHTARCTYDRNKAVWVSKTSFLTFRLLSWCTYFYFIKPFNF